MTEDANLRPTRAGTVKFGLLYAGFLIAPIAITFVAFQGPSISTFAGLAAGYLIATLAFGAFVASGLYGFTPTDAGLRSGSRRAKVLPWEEIDRIETGRLLGQEIWVRVIGRPEDGRRPPVLAVFPAFVYGMSAPELRDFLITFLSRRTGSPT